MAEYNLSEDEKKLLHWLMLAKYHANSCDVFEEDVEFARRELDLSEDKLLDLDALCKKYDFVTKVEKGHYRLDHELISAHEEELLVRKETTQLVDAMNTH